jgi:polyferredoxin
MLKKIITHRKFIHITLAALVIFAMVRLEIKLLWIMVFGSLLGVVLGKTFCRWMCPMGVLMCTIIGGSDKNAMGNQYQYFKLGCPIAWASGFLNRFSIFKVKKKASLCTNCGLCDKACYITEFDDNCSLYKDDKFNASMASSCSRCLECVKVCPTGSLKYKP